MSLPTLDDCKEITIEEYNKLPGTPKFIGQTLLNKENMYWMTFKSEGILYKIENKL